MSKLKIFPFKTVEFYCSPNNSKNHYSGKYLTYDSYDYKGYPVDVDKDNTTAIKNSYYTNPQGKRVEGEYFLEDNLFEDIELSNLYYKNHGFDYNVIITISTGERIRVTLKDSVFNEFIMNGGTIKNRVLKGKWRFINNSGALLVPVGSILDTRYQKENSEDKFKGITKVKVKDLKVGEIYKNKASLDNDYIQFMVYLGKCYSITSKQGSWNRNGSKSFEGKVRHTFLDIDSYSRKSEWNNLKKDRTPPLSNLRFSFISNKTLPEMYTGFTISNIEKDVLKEIKSKGIGMTANQQYLNFEFKCSRTYSYYSSKKGFDYRIKTNFNSPYNQKVICSEKKPLEDLNNKIDKKLSTIKGDFSENIGLKHSEISDFWSF